MNKKNDNSIPSTNLTWKDIKVIVNIADEEIELLSKKELINMGEEGYYTHILNQYSSLKKEGLI